RGRGRPPPAFGRRPRLRGGYLRCDLAGELVLDVGADDLIEARLRPEAERPRALRLEPLRPAADDPGDRRIVLAANAGRHLVSGDSPQRLDLLADRAGYPRHREIDPLAERLARQRGRVH